MKRGKDEEKMMGPMFPRLHVNDASKGGPKAPPRNKMALYEQFSTPSHRHRHLVLPRNPTASAATVPSSSQGAANEDVFMSYQLPTEHQSKKQYGQCLDTSTPLMQVEQRKKLDEDDFRVPIFVHSVLNPERGKHSMGKLAPKPSGVSEPLKFQKTMTGIMGSGAMQEDKTQKKENLRESAIGIFKAVSNPLAHGKAEGKKRQTDLPVCQEPGYKPTNSIGRFATGDCTEPTLCFEAQTASEWHGAVVAGENNTALDKGNSSISVMADPSEDQNIYHDCSNDTESCENRSARGNSGVSETSGVDSNSRPDITPDDVVGVIGQKHFWKARRAIANQQRVFAIQVFELHRLLKIQRLLAASPHLLLEDTPYVGKSTKNLPQEKIPSNPHIKEFPDVSKQKGESDNKPSQKEESSAKNTICKPPCPSIQNGISSNNSPAPSINNVQWYQPRGQQWLIPVMSPTEGLIYKPYPGHGYAGPGCGGCGPPAPNLDMGSFYPSAYGVPAPHPPYQLHHHHGYFPQYGMPVMYPAPFSVSSVEQMNAPSDPGNLSTGNQNIPNTQTSNDWASPEAVNNVPEDMEVQASTTSSSVERMQDSRANSSMNGRNALTLFPMTPALDAPKVNPPPLELERPTQVIKVVPHNAVSATESAVRIFRSIQEERRRYDST